MSETTVEPTTDEQPTLPEPDATEDQGNPGEEALGDAGKQALDRMKAERNEAKQTAKALQQQVEELRQAQQSQLDAIAKALGLKGEGDEAPDPAKLTEQLTAEQTRAREAAVQLAVYRSPAAKDTDVDGLLDSTSFQRTLADVDPTDAAAVDAAVKAFVDANPRFKAADTFPSPGQVGIGVSGGGSGPVDPVEADRRQIEADLAAAKRR